MVSHVKRRKTLCTRCGINPRATGQRWCNGCAATYMRGYRKTLKEKRAALERLALEGVIAKGLRRMAEGVAGG